MVESDITVDPAAAFGAYAVGQRFTMCAPHKDAKSRHVAQARWVDEDLHLLSSFSGGVSAMPPIEGAWLNPQTQELILEEPGSYTATLRPMSLPASCPPCANLSIALAAKLAKAKWRFT